PARLQGGMDGGKHMIIGRGSGGGRDIDNQMRSRGVTGFREMHLVADPLHRTLGAVTRLRVIRGGDEFRRGWHVFDLAPAQRSIDLYILFGPDAAEGLDGGELPQPRLLADGVKRLEERLAI